MLKKTILFSTLLVALVGLFTITNLIIVRPSDYHEFQKFLDVWTTTTTNIKTLEPAHQSRKNVQKDIWFSDDEKRLHLRLKSEESELIITQEKNSVHLIEKLKNIECFMQDKFLKDENSQQVRYFTAKQGTYLFPSHHFFSETVQLAFFQAPGQNLPESFDINTSFLKGTAKEVSFFLSDNTPLFSAYRLRASLDSSRGLP